jgi:spermidine synthase
MDPQTASRETGGPLLWLLHLFMFLSGLSALVYEVVWLRALGLVFGNTTYALATVLAAYMGGLGLGGFVVGRWADRRRHPLLVYGLLELGIGLYAALTFVLLRGIRVSYVLFAHHVSDELEWLTLVRLLLSFAVIFVPTFLMGGTLPVLIRASVARRDTIGVRTSSLYALNTLGAVTGTLVAGLWWIPALGMRRTLAAAVLINLALGIVACLRGRSVAAAAPAVAVDARAATGPVRGLARWIIVGLFLSGVAAMWLEVGWTRILAALIGNSTYAFTLMLSTFLLGLSLGSAVYRRVLASRAAEAGDWAWLQVVLAITVVASLSAFEHIDLLTVRAYGLTMGNAVAMDVVSFLLCAGIMLVPAACLGALFPVSAALYAQGVETAGRDVGVVYLSNALGNIVGSLAGGFVLVPLLGIHHTLLAAATVSLALGLGMGLRHLSRGLVHRALLVVAAACVALSALAQRGGWDPHRISMGLHTHPRLFVTDTARAILGNLYDWKLHYYREGLSSIISVFGRGDELSLKSNGKTDASTSGDEPTQLLLGHLPHMLHPDARRSLVIGLGCGMTLSAVVAHELEQVDCVEIEPAVVEAARCFDHVNRRAYENPSVRMLVGDGRNHLMMERGTYDVIVSEPSNPWIAGVATLFTVEFYELVRDRLRPGGVLCQWIQVYQLSPADFRMVIATLKEVFPHVTLWALPGDMLILAGMEPLAFDLDRAEQRFAELPNVREDFKELGMSGPAALLSYFELNEEDLAEMVEGAGINRDDALPLEFSAPRSLHVGELLGLNHRLLDARRSTSFLPIKAEGGPWHERADVLTQIGTAYLSQNFEGVLATAQWYLEKAVSLDPANTDARVGLARCYIEAGEWRRGAELLHECVSAAPDHADARLYAALSERRWGNANAAADLAAAFEPDHVPSWRHMLWKAVFLAEAGRWPGAEEAYRVTLTMNPENFDARLGLVTCLRAQDQLDEATTAIEALRQDHPTVSRVYEELCAVYDERGQIQPQIEAYEELVEGNPYRTSYLVELILLYNRAGESDLAGEARRRGRMLYPYFDDLLVVYGAE